MRSTAPAVGQQPDVSRAGKTVVGGGATLTVGTASLANLAISKSEPGNISGSPAKATQWDATGTEIANENGTWSVTARVICATG